MKFKARLSRRTMKPRWKVDIFSKKQLAVAELAKCGLTSINPFKMKQNVINTTDTVGVQREATQGEP